MSRKKFTINKIMDFTSFSHGQIQSKTWLCQNLEPHIPPDARIAILGCWYNVLGFIMLTRNENICQHILGIDIDPSVKETADQINNAWTTFGDTPKVSHVTADANTYNLYGYRVVVNCSPEHMESNQWFENIDDGATVCLQSSDIDIKDDAVWKCTNPNKSIEDFREKYPLSQYLFAGTKEFRYGDWGYQRFMIIGIK